MPPHFSHWVIIYCSKRIPCTEIIKFFNSNVRFLQPEMVGSKKIVLTVSFVVVLSNIWRKVQEDDVTKIKVYFLPNVMCKKHAHVSIGMSPDFFLFKYSCFAIFSWIQNVNLSEFDIFLCVIHIEASEQISLLSIWQDKQCTQACFRQYSRRRCSCLHLASLVLVPGPAAGVLCGPYELGCCTTHLSLLHLWARRTPKQTFTRQLWM